MPLDPRIEAIREKYGLARDDFWELPQKKGKWLVKHSALEIVAAKAGITFDPPQILEADGGNGVAAVCVTGQLGERRIWSIGEASPKNSKNAYPWAMSEKRALDRVILKLVGIHGLVYSEDEADDFKHHAPAAQSHHDEPPEEMSNTAAKVHWKAISDELFACTTLKQLQGAWQRHYPVFLQLPEHLQRELTTFKDELKDKLLAQPNGGVAQRVPAKATLARQFRETQGTPDDPFKVEGKPPANTMGEWLDQTEEQGAAQ